jgi:hypothetical protein
MTTQTEPHPAPFGSAEAGRLGGLAKNERKTAANKQNGLKPCREGKRRGNPNFQKATPIPTT